MKKEFDIEFLQLSLKQNINLLKCFDEFCDESVMSEQSTMQEKEANAYWFSKRLSSKRSLLEVSIRNLEENCNELQEFINSKPLSEVQRNG